jgi:hypothetical protein
MQHLRGHACALSLLHRLAGAAAQQQQRWSAISSCPPVQALAVQQPSHEHCQQRSQQRLLSSLPADLKQHSCATRVLANKASRYTFHAAQHPWTQQQSSTQHQLQQLRTYSDDAARRRLLAAQQRRERERELQERRSAAPAAPADQQQQQQPQQDNAAADAPRPAADGAYALTPVEAPPSEAQVGGSVW